MISGVPYLVMASFKASTQKLASNVLDMQHFDVLGARFGPLNAAPPMTLLGVTRLAIPELMFEIEATAAD